MLRRNLVFSAAVLLGSAALALQAIPDRARASPWRADEDNTRGWQLMSQQERIDHQARVRSFTDYDTCKAYRKQHHELMEQRARERGLKLFDDREGFCWRLKRDAQPEQD
ncbi:hypothetical protein HUU61_02890 [Rhodopseudomonas palustris]|nr:hypothetical protein [Rhodopseudomonas palustris]